MVKGHGPCLYPHCLYTPKNACRRQHHDILPHFRCQNCDKVAPKHLQAHHKCTEGHHLGETPILARQPPQSPISKRLKPCWCTRCPLKSSNSILRHSARPHYICETCDTMQVEKKIFVGRKDSQRHENPNLGHLEMSNLVFSELQHDGHTACG